MPNNTIKLPGVYYTENVTYELTGEGSKIPVFIGKTGNTATGNYKTNGTEILTFTGIADVLSPIVGTGDDWRTKTGILNEFNLDEKGNVVIPETNELAKVIFEFYEEARLLQSSDIGVPYIYVVDLGNADDRTAWVTALDTVKGLFDATVEVYVGAYMEGTGENKSATMFKKDNTTYSVTDFLSSASYSIASEAEDLNLRYGFTAVKGATDEDLINLSKAIINGVDGTTHFVKHYSRMGLIEYDLFGKHIARICCTPNNTEPGYYTFRSVSPEKFKKRTKREMILLQTNGIIFGRDEHINGNVYPKINLCTSIAFASTTRPADSLFHARFNADDLLREVFEACYPQVKANESATNIAYLQTRVNKIVTDRVTAEEMIKYNERTEEGTKLIVSAGYDDPYSIIVKGQIQPVKCTVAIEVDATIRL